MLPRPSLIGVFSGLWFPLRSYGASPIPLLIGKSPICMLRWLMTNEIDMRRQACAQTAADILASPHVYIDTETSGLHNPRIVQIAIADSDGNALLNTLVHQRWAIPSKATAIHGITTEMTKAAPRWAEILPAVVALTAGKTAIIYNTAFDLGAIAHTCAISAVPCPRLSTGCAMTLYAEYAGEWSDYWERYRFIRLSRAAAAFGHLHQHAHDALSDCIATRAVMHGMANSIKD